MYIEKYKHGYVYPGHALVIAICIMEKYPSLEEALKPCVSKHTGEPHGYPNALGDQDIPGAGSCVYLALDVLKMEDIEKAIEFANTLWKGECSDGYKDRYNTGVEQAKELEPVFRELRTRWRNKNG
jgi:hypothetical protein